MSNESKKYPKGRMIHIRLDVDTHKRPQIHVVRTNSSIQQIVGALIKDNFGKGLPRDSK